MTPREYVRSLVRERIRRSAQARSALELSSIPAPGGGRCTAVIDLAFDLEYADGPEAVAGAEWTDAALVQMWTDEYGLSLRTV
jgi:hypothetical protein